MPLDKDNKQRRFEEAATADLVRRRDVDRYWSTLFAPAGRRAALLALYAYNAEIAHIAATTNEPMVGQIRLQWWKDAIELAVPGTRTGNPIADSLAGAIFEHDLPKDRLIGMAEARIPEIVGDAPVDIAALRASLQATQGTVFELAAGILGSEGELARKAGEHAGLAYGLMQTLRTVPLQAARRKLMLPLPYLESRGVNIAFIYRGQTDASFGGALAELRGAVGRALHQFRTLSPELDPLVWPAFLPLAVIKPYLRAMAAPAFDPLHTIPTVSPLRQFWRIWRAARRGSL
ncbi:MAG: squalene/phytoene synthase family protein [Rhodomicrobium sp.]